MGIHKQCIDLLIHLKQNNYITNSTSVIEIGAQQLSNAFLESHTELNEIGRLFGASLPHPFPSPIRSHIVHGSLEHQEASAPSARNFWQWLGFTYASIDIDGSPGSIPLDLNYDQVDHRQRGRHHLVTNLGTTEHVANQLNAFKVIHDLTAVGGVMLHHLPAQGMMNHGLINYNPKFFWMLARSNGYKWIYANYIGLPPHYELPQNIVDSILPHAPEILQCRKDHLVTDSMLTIIMQKVFATPYVAPLDVATGTKTTNKTLENRYWSVFKENAFDIKLHTPREKLTRHLANLMKKISMRTKD